LRVAAGPAARRRALTEIAGSATIRRTLFGVHLYDIVLGSDGIVPVTSQLGYLGSTASGTPVPRGAQVQLRTDSCTVNDDTLQTAALAAGLSGNLITAGLAAAGQFWADGNALDGVLSGQLSPALIPYLGLVTVAAPCSHLHVYEDPAALDAAAEVLRGYLKAYQPLTAASLLSAPVPSLCQHPAGRLVNGHLPGIPANRGSVELAWAYGLRSDHDMMTVGDLNGDGISDAAAVVSCNAGGVGWPDQIVFYTHGPTVLGAYDLSTAVGGARDGTLRISYSSRAVQVTSLDARRYDFGCCASGRATLTLRWTDAGIIASEVQHLPGPKEARFDGVGQLRLGMTRAQIEGLDYRSSPYNYYGCVFFDAPGRPSLTFDPSRNSVVAITVDRTYRTTEGLGIGSLLSQVREAFAGHVIENHLDHSFGQGSDGLLVGGAGGWLAFTTEDGFTVSSLRVGDHHHATNAEVGCPT
jgi:hypothetical protein